MPKFLFRGGYSPEGLRGLAKKKASARQEAIAKNLERWGKDSTLFTKPPMRSIGTSTIWLKLECERMRSVIMASCRLGLDLGIQRYSHVATMRV
jgi:hypothetical protein